MKRRRNLWTPAQDRKLRALERIVRRVREPLIIFTEYRDTLEAIAGAIGQVIYASAKAEEMIEQFNGAQSSSPAIDSEGLGRSSQVTEVAPPLDLWDRIRRGFAMPDLQNDLVQNQEQWYAARPEYIGRMTERSRKYLFHIVEELERPKAMNPPRMMTAIRIAKTISIKVKAARRPASASWRSRSASACATCAARVG